MRTVRERKPNMLRKEFVKERDTDSLEKQKVRIKMFNSKIG